jgi:hypothetical protein
MSLFHTQSSESIGPTNNSPPSPIYTLNNDTLLNIFYLYRLHIADEEEDEHHDALFIRKCQWDRQRWWYELVQVCRWWRFIILASSSVLDLHLVCTYGVPVADMLKHSPCPGLPLTIFYDDDTCEMKRKDEEGALLAISQHRNRVRRITLRIPPPKLQRLISAMNEEFPILDRLNLETSTQSFHNGAILPQTFLAPNLRHIYLWGVALPTQSPLRALLTTTRSLVFLWLGGVPRSAYFPPNHMVTWLSLIPLLETLGIDLNYDLPSPNPYVVTDTATTTQMTLPNLRLFYFRGVTAYLECLLSHIVAPVLSTFLVRFRNQWTFTIPQTFQFLNLSESLQFNTFELAFTEDSVKFRADPHRAFWTRPLYLQIMCNFSPGRQVVVSTVQILRTLTPILSVVEQLTITLTTARSYSYIGHLDRTQWRGLLSPFNNVKALHVASDPDDLIVQKLSRSLPSVEGESPLELLPNLEELTYSNWRIGHAFIPFINERRAAGHPVRSNCAFNIPTQ